MTFIDRLTSPDINNNKSPCIVGIQKCGQSTLAVWLRKYYDNVLKNEILHKIPPSIGTETFAKLADTHFPVIIIRDRPTVILSRYYNWFIKTLTFKQFLHHNYKSVNPLYQTNYSSLIEPWLKYSPYILCLEEVRKHPGFGHINHTIRSGYPRPVKPKELALIQEALSVYNPALLKDR